MNGTVTCVACTQQKAEGVLLLSWPIRSMDEVTSMHMQLQHGKPLILCDAIFQEM
jgi:hypothetical protein